MLIRNVTTDIRGFGFDGGVRVPDGNSIFIFEVAQLCIGHVGHLHHELGAEDLAFLGQLDIVMVPVDGSMTMSQAAMVETLKIVKARLVLPMHYFGLATLQPLPHLSRRDFRGGDGPRAGDRGLRAHPAAEPEGAGAAGLLAKQPAAHATLSRRGSRRRRPAPGTSARRLRSARRIGAASMPHRGAGIGTAAAADEALVDAEDRSERRRRPPRHKASPLRSASRIAARRAWSSSGVGSATVKVGPEMEFAPSVTTWSRISPTRSSSRMRSVMLLLTL